MVKEITVINSNPATTVLFPEPVVSRSVAQADDDASPEDRGVNLFRIEGDARYVPQAEWEDQDRLKLHFPVGTSYKTSYKLIFNKDVTYLSGAAITPRELEFRCEQD